MEMLKNNNINSNIISTLELNFFQEIKVVIFTWILSYFWSFPAISPCLIFSISDIRQIYIFILKMFVKYCEAK